MIEPKSTHARPAYETNEENYTHTHDNLTRK